MLKKHAELQTLYLEKYVEEQPRTVDDLVSLKSDEWDGVSIDMKNLISFDSDSIYDLINEQSDFVSASKSIQQVEEITNSVIEKLPTDYIKGHAIRIMKLGDFFDRKVKETYEVTFLTFEESLKLLESSVAIDTAVKYREKTNSIHSNLESLLDIAKERDLNISNKKAVESYAKKLTKINELEKQYAEIVSDYQAIDSKDGAKDKIENICTKFSGGLFESSLLSKAKKIVYVERIGDFELLKNELDKAKVEFSTFFETRQNVKNHIDYVEEEIEYISYIGNKSELEYNVLAKLKVISKDDFSANKWQPAIYYNNFASEYVVKGNLLKEKAKKVLSNSPRIMRELENKVKDVRVDTFYDGSNHVYAQEVSFYSLKLGVSLLSNPKNGTYYRIANILSGNNGENNWNNLFNNFISEIAKVSISAKSEYDYLNRVASEINKAIENPEPKFAIDSAKVAYESLKCKLMNY